MLYDPRRQRPGPLVDDTVLFKSAPSVIALFSGKYLMEDIVFEEQLPLTQLFCDASLIYGAKASELLPAIS